MPSVQHFRDGLTDDSLRMAILVGLATVPFTLLFSWEPVTDGVSVLGGSISGLPLLLAGLYVGYRYSDRATESRRAGIWTGLVASFGTALIYVTNTVTTIRSVSLEWAIAAVAATPVVVAFGAGVTVLITTLVAQFADWVRSRLARDRRVADRAETDGEHVAASRWWLPVAVYAVLAPVVLGCTLWVMPESGVGVVVSAVGLLVLVPFSVVTLVGLFVDATAPRDEEIAWFPNAPLYAGVPFGAYALAYLAATAWALDYPPGYGIYAFLVALWLTSAVYLTRRRRYVGTLPIHST